MKKTSIILGLVLATALSSCSRNEDGFTFKKEDFVGIGEDKMLFESETNDAMELNSSSFYCDNLCTVAINDISFTYTFDGNYGLPCYCSIK